MSQIEIAHSISSLEDTVNKIEATDPHKRLMATLLSLPQLRAAWTMGQIDYQAANQVLDLGGGGYHLTNNATVTFCEENSAPYANFNTALNQYLSRADGGAGNWADILGTEAYVLAAQRGLTFGGWFQVYDLTAYDFLIGKSDNTVANASYQIVFRGDVANDPFRFLVGTGAATVSVDIQITPAIDTWYYLVGRYDPSTEIKIYAGAGGALLSETLAVGIPAALNDSNSAFTIGSFSGGANYLDGRASMCFLCASMLSDSWVRCLYSQTRSIFRV